MNEQKIAIQNFQMNLHPDPELEQGLLFRSMWSQLNDTLNRLIKNRYIWVRFNEMVNTLSEHKFIWVEWYSVW